MAHYRLTLYTRGHTPVSIRAKAEVRALAATLVDRCELVLVDVLERPDLAEAVDLAYTPTLAVESGGRSRMIVSDFSDREWMRKLYESGPPDPDPPGPSLPG